jgi:hypothetical protein
MQKNTKLHAFTVAGIAALASGFVTTVLRSGAVFTFTANSTALIFGRSLGLWILGAIAVLAGKPENMQRNALITIFAALSLSVLRLV